MSKIAEILRAYPPDCQPTAVESIGNAGGMSGAQFWRFVAPRGTLALRCWPIEHPSPERLEFIHAVLRHAADHGLQFLPMPIATTTGATFVRQDGRLWELAPWLPGTADYEQAPRAEKLRAAMIALADLHIAVRDFPRPPAPGSAGGAPAITHRLARLIELQNGGIDELARAITDDRWPELAPRARQFVTEFCRVAPIAIRQLTPLADQPFRVQLCIRDIWHDHILFTGDAVTGIIDFGAVDFDTPATDVARLLGSLIGDNSSGWDEGIRAYSSICVLTDSEAHAIPLLDVAGTLLAGCNWIRWIHVEGREFDAPTTIISRFNRILRRII